MSKLLTVLLLFSLAGSSVAAVEEDIASVRYQVTSIEHLYKDDQKKEKVQALDDVINSAQRIISQNPDQAEGYVWKGIALSAQAKHKGKGFGALSTAKKAKFYLEKSIKIDPTASGAAAYNALGMLYYKVPGWPVGFGNKTRAREYFEKAVQTSSNLDTNYRYGEYLLLSGEKDEGLKYLEKALDFPNRPGRREEELKKQEIQDLIILHRKTFNQ